MLFLASKNVVLFHWIGEKSLACCLPSNGSKGLGGNVAAAEALDASFKEYMESIRQSDKPMAKQKLIKVSILSGKSVQVTDFPIEDSTDTHE